MRNLFDLIKRRIETTGPISVADYMDLCLGHPQYGYYMSRDPFGEKGDFTTAPEISQMFGEMIGLWSADMWMKLGSPASFTFAECGPGRGTLMKDMLRACRIVPGFAAAAEIHLIETSPLLIEKQRQNLVGYNVTWNASIDALPEDKPLILIGNEFLDALPVHQAVMTGSGWRERRIGLRDDELIFGLGNTLLGDDMPDAPENEIYEYSPFQDAIWTNICDRIRQQRGAALVIDYGFTADATGDTLQAVKDHEYVSVFQSPGECDLTTHVNFARLQRLAHDLNIHGPVTQEIFLKDLGIELRAEKLITANPQMREKITSELQRLTARDQMGELFKVMHVSNL